MSKIAAVAVIMILFTTIGYGQTQNTNVFLGYAYSSTDTNIGTASRANLNGWDLALEAKVHSFLSIVADFNGNYGKQDYGTQTVPSNPPTVYRVSADVSQTNILFGPRASIEMGKLRPFVHGLVGVSRLSEQGPTYNSFAYAIGGGVDYHLIPHISWRVQADALQTRFFSGTQFDVRAVTGVVVRF